MSLCRCLHFSLSLQLSTQCWSPLWALATLVPWTPSSISSTWGDTGPVLVPPPCSSAWKLSQGSKLGTFVAVSLFLVSKVSLCCFLSSAFSAVVYSFVRLSLFHIRKLRPAPFIHCIWMGSHVIVILWVSSWAAARAHWACCGLCVALSSESTQSFSLFNLSM